MDFERAFYHGSKGVCLAICWFGPPVKLLDVSKLDFFSITARNSCFTTTSQRNLIHFDED